MEITKETKLSDLLDQYSWLKEELSKVNDKFRMADLLVSDRKSTVYMVKTA